jgi:S1-C subfamily serine protease
MTAQDTGVLRIRVVLEDATGAATPIPRVVLLVSDNPATAEPRRVRTSADGSIELRLRPGSYTVESDQAVAFGGNAYAWTETLDVAGGREIVLDLTAKNAEITPASAATPGAAPAIEADSATILAKWQDAVVEIWTPVQHASGLVVDRRGLIATSQRAIGNATDVEVEMVAAGTRRKVPGVVIHSDRLAGTAVVRVDPQATAALRAPDSSCAEPAAPEYRDEVVAIAAPMLGGKEMTDGEVTRVTPQAIFVDVRLVRDAAGGPVFSEGGQLLGLSAIAITEDRRGRDEVFIVPMSSVCETLAAAEKKLNGAPPRFTELPLEPPRTPNRVVAAKSTAKKTAPAALSTSDFDIRLLTPEQLREYGNATPQSDVANWNDYIRDVPPVLLIRVSPQFEESFWKMLARGAAATQGMALPPLKSFSANFSRMRAFCGDNEVTPIHPLIIERPVSETASIREGLYVYAREAFGPHCASVRLLLYSEKAPDKPDSRTIDPKLFEQLQ